MDAEEITQRKQEVVDRYGSWTAHNIQLDDNLYTIEPRIVGDEVKLRRITQVIADIAGKPLPELRVLDLGSLEGLYAIELARHGANVVAIEVREANIEKIRFAKEALALDNLEVFADDVRNLDRKKYGQFDIVLCLGLLYHLDIPDLFDFVKRIAEVSSRAAIFDTHVSLLDEISQSYEGQDYWGVSFLEHREDETEEERNGKLWASADNPQSFWLTRASLENLLAHVGYTSVYECHNPPEVDKPIDRLTLVAVKGQRAELLSAPLMNDRADDRWPEKPRVTESPLRRVGRRVVNKLLK